MRKAAAIAVMTLLVVFPALAAGCGSSAREAGGEEEAAGEVGIVEVSYLYTLDAHSGTFAREAEGEYLLQLEEVSGMTTRFSDRPVREADVMTTSSFMANWDNYFSDSPPNAALIFADPVEGGEDTAVFILAEPVYDEDAGTLSFRATDIPQEEGAEAETWDGMPVAELPESFGAACLFIDSAQRYKKDEVDKYSYENTYLSVDTSLRIGDLDDTYVMLYFYDDTEGMRAWCYPDIPGAIHEWDDWRGKTHFESGDLAVDVTVEADFSGFYESGYTYGDYYVYVYVQGTYEGVALEDDRPVAVFGGNYDNRY